jgi:hypothetical protein
MIEVVKLHGIRGSGKALMFSVISVTRLAFVPRQL